MAKKPTQKENLMGLLDFFKGRSHNKKKDEPAMEENKEVPRCAYYIFPHVALRQFAFASPYLCMGALGASEGNRFLPDILASVADYCRGEGQEMTLAAEHIRFYSLRAKKYPCLIVELPEPHASTEVFMVGIVLKPAAGDTAADLPGAEVRYFTLEKGRRPDGSGRTVLCEWTIDNRHLNYGDGPEPDRDHFLKAIAEKCS